MNKPRILICDDDAEFLKSLQLSLRSAFEIHAANSIVRAKALAATHEYDAAIVDLCFEGQELDGIHLLDHLDKAVPDTFLIVLSGDESVKRVVDAMRRRLLEFIHKEGDFFPALQTALTRGVQLRRAKQAQTTERYLTESPKVREVLKNAERILSSSSDAPLLILGDTGTGKEFLAKHISQSLKMRVIAANMAAIPRETAESVLFGHERGAFTGATANKIGLIESVNGGIFFLDEIGECSLAVQAKLLRVIQEKEILPLGGVRPRKIHVRFVAATHQNLDQMVANGTFRQDLLQRLNTFILRLPSLRERPEDVLFYANLFLEEFGAQEVRHSIASDGAQELLAYSWPGNIRELRSVIQRITVLSGRTLIDAQAVRDALQLGRSPEAAKSKDNVVGILEGNVRRDQLLRALTESGGSKRLAARALSISEATIYRWIQQFGLTSWPHQPEAGRSASLQSQERA